jgi:hypothetical protein
MVARRRVRVGHRVDRVVCVFGLPGAKIGILANLLLLAYLAATKLGWL